MKKILSIILLGLLQFIPVSASENLYLTCPQNITEDNSADHIREFHKSFGEIHQYHYFDIKIKKSEIYIKVYLHAPEPGKTWSNVKPTIFLNSINKDEVIKIDDIKLNLPKEVIEARVYQYNLI